jgi:hypothetical protein
MVDLVLSEAGAVRDVNFKDDAKLPTTARYVLVTPVFWTQFDGQPWSGVVEGGSSVSFQPTSFT